MQCCPLQVLCLCLNLYVPIWAMLSWLSKLCFPYILHPLWLWQSCFPSSVRDVLEAKESELYAFCSQARFSVLGPVVLGQVIGRECPLGKPKQPRLVLRQRVVLLKIDSWASLQRHIYTIHWPQRGQAGACSEPSPLCSSLFGTVKHSTI